MSFDVELTMKVLLNRKVSSPLEQGNVFRLNALDKGESVRAFQSLWNRAMSFDYAMRAELSAIQVSIPLEQGNVFRRKPNRL